MALTITRTGDWQGNPGDRISSRVTIAFDNDYPTGGESLTPADLGMGEFDVVVIGSKGGYVFEYDYTAKTVLVFQGPVAAGVLDQAANNADLSTLTGVRVYAIGRP